MSLVKIEASFDPSNPAQLTAAMNFLSAVGGNVIPSGTAAPAETTTADAPKEDATGPGNTTEEKSETTITLEDIRTLTSKKAKDHREAIKAKLTEWGVPNVVKIPTEKYAEFIDFLNSL